MSRLLLVAVLQLFALTAHAAPGTTCDTDSMIVAEAYVPSAGADGASDTGDGPIPWCVSPDDPRCAPAHDGTPVAPDLAVRRLVARSGTAVPDAPLARTLPSWERYASGIARDAARARLERPPCAG